MRTMVEKATGPVMIVMGMTLAVFMGSQVNNGLNMIQGNKTLMSWCNSGEHWCSGSFIDSLTATNQQIGMFAAFFFLLLVTGASLAIGGAIFTAAERDSRVRVKAW